MCCPPRVGFLFIPGELSVYFSSTNEAKPSRVCEIVTRVNDDSGTVDVPKFIGNFFLRHLRQGDGFNPRI